MDTLKKEALLPASKVLALARVSAPVRAASASAAFSLLVPTSHIQINVKLCLFFGFKVDSSLSSLQHDLTKLATAVYFL